MQDVRKKSKKWTGWMKMSKILGSQVAWELKKAK